MVTLTDMTECCGSPSELKLIVVQHLRLYMVRELVKKTSLS